jgi:hypothetical protein
MAADDSAAGPAAGGRTAPDAGSGGASGRPSAPRRRRRAPDSDHALRDLVGGGQSQLGDDGALRGRDVNRPTDEDLAWAEDTVVVVRRNWTPPPA